MTSSRIMKSYVLMTERMSLVRALYIVSVASNGPQDEVTFEFRQAVGDVLEGMALEQLRLTHIDKERVSEEVKWLQERT